MNWNEISENYPNAFKCLKGAHATIEAWAEIDSPEVWEDFIEEPHWVMRHLFDFFDDQEIFITVGRRPGDEFWWWVVLWDEERVDCVFNTLTSRPHSETEAFTKAFEILEEKLTS